MNYYRIPFIPFASITVVVFIITSPLYWFITKAIDSTDELTLFECFKESVEPIR